MRVLQLSVFLLLLSTTVGLSQTTPPLERQLSISFEGILIDAALNKLSKQGQFTFSYNPAILKSNFTISKVYDNNSVREILNDWFGKSINAKEKGNYIILTKAPAPTKKEIVNNTVTITGYVTNGETGEKISEVSVYDKKSLTGAITNQFGFFRITLNNPNEEAVLSFNKRSFKDTLITLNSSSTQFMNMVMMPEVQVGVAEIESSEDSVEVVVTIPVAQPDIDPLPIEPAQKRSFRDFLQKKIFSKNIFSKKKGGVNVNNINDPLYRDFQVSFVPFVGSNHKLSGNVINDYSVNVLGGYSRGTRKVEFGGLFNIDRGDVSYAQFAGLFNTVGGETYGVQMAGLGNLTRGQVTGSQFAGLLNANLDSVNAVQLAGLFNVNGRTSQGVQMAGLFNLQPSYYKGSQFAGLLNIATHQMHGTQIAGLLNFAHHIRGAQIGLVNYADSVRGVPLGLLSIVSKGYHKIELSADEIFYINASFRTGVRQFYNILTVGLKPESLNGSTPGSPNPSQENVWTFGYGIGTAPKLTNKLFLNVDLTANHVNEGSFTNSTSLLNKLYVGFDYQIARKISIAGGITLNGYMFDPSFNENPTLFTDFSPSIVNTHTFFSGHQLKMWWGAKFGIRFL